jgi:hypothetical protein
VGEGVLGGDRCVTVRARQKAPRRRTWTLWSDPLSTRPPSTVTVPLDPDSQPSRRCASADPWRGLPGVTGRGERQLAGGLRGGAAGGGVGYNGVAGPGAGPPTP